MSEQRTAGSDQVSADRPAPAAAAPASSRRTLLVSGAGALLGFVASALGRPAPVRADGEILHVGDDLATAVTETRITNVANSNNVLIGASGAGGIGVQGLSDGGFGVYGQSSSNNGVRGQSDSSYGVAGASSTSLGVYGTSVSSIGVGGSSSAWIGVSGSSGSAYGVYGEANGSGAGAIGVHGTTVSGIGMLGKSRAAAQPGAVGWSAGNSTGVQGFSNDNSANPPAPRAKTGVFGQATQDSASNGVLGVSGSGNGVRGEASTGVGVQGVASNAAGYAIRGSGRVRLDKVSGQATLAAGTTSKTITPGTDLTADSLVLLTPAADLAGRRLWYTKDTTNNRFTIRMSSSRTSSTVIAWLLLS